MLNKLKKSEKYMCILKIHCVKWKIHLKIIYYIYMNTNIVESLCIKWGKIIIIKIKCALEIKKEAKNEKQ